MALFTNQVILARKQRKDYFGFLSVPPSHLSTTTHNGGGFFTLSLSMPNAKRERCEYQYQVFGVKWPRNRNRVYRVIETVSVTDARVTQTLLEPVTDH